MSDEDLRGLCDRFSLETPSQLQGMLLALQSKAFILRASLNNSLQQRVVLSGSSLDLNWRVPAEGRTALHVTLPITSFDIQAPRNREKSTLKIKMAAYTNLLPDPLLYA